MCINRTGFDHWGASERFLKEEEYENEDGDEGPSGSNDNNSNDKDAGDDDSDAKDRDDNKDTSKVAEAPRPINQNFFQPYEYEKFRAIMTQDLGIQSERVDHWISKIEQGWDEALKGMLFCLLPGLDRLCFLSGEEDYLQGMLHPLTFLNEAISSVSRPSTSNTVAWPPGLRHLRAISIGMPHDSVDRDRRYLTTATDVAPLFSLPNLKILRLENIDDEGDPFNLEANKSTVEELTFRECSLDLESIRVLIRACKALRKVSCDVGPTPYASTNEARKAEVHRILVEECSDSLECLDGRDFSCLSLADAAEFLKHFGKLKVVEQHLSVDVLQSTTASDQWFYWPEVEIDLGPLNGKQYAVEKVAIADLRQLLPPSIETLGLDYEVNGHSAHFKPRSFAIRGELLRSIADLVEDERFGNLTDICLKHLCLIGAHGEEIEAWG